MKTVLKTFALASAFVLIGAGCTLFPSAGIGDLPTTPPEDAMMVPETDDEVLVDGESEGMMIDDREAGGDMMVEDENDGEAKMENDDSATNEESKVKGQESKVAKPYYIAYTADVAVSAQAEGRPVVYYFWAAWCPICRAEEPKIKSWIESSEHPIAGFRVNFDTESALKAQFGIPYQHTTVFLNANGEEVERFLGPVTEAEFRAALALASN